MTPEDEKFDDEEYFSKRKEEKYFFKKDDDYFGGGRYSRYEDNKHRYPHDEEQNEDIYPTNKQHDAGKYRSYRRDEDSFEEEKRDEPEIKKFKDRFSDDFFKDEDFDYGDDEEVPSGEDPEDYTARTKRIKQKRRKRKVIASSILIFILVVALGVGVFFGIKFFKNKLLESAEGSATTTSSETINIPSNLQLNEDLNIAVAGAGDNLLEPDINFIFYSRFDSKNNNLTTLAIPINTLMDIPGFGLESADKSVKFGGMDLLILTLKKALGMDINKYIIFDIKDIAEKLGGITVNLDNAVTITNFEDGSPIELKQGENKLDATAAISYFKFFSGTQKDVAVNLTVNQKKVFDALFLQLAGSSDEDLKKGLNSIKNFYETNLTETEIYQFISTVSRLKSENNNVFPLDVTTVELEGGNIFYVPDISKLAQIFKTSGSQTTASTQLSNITADLQVLNGVGTPGIAGKVSALFKDLKYDDGTAKFNVLEAKNADNSNYSATQIIVNSQDPSYMALADEIRNILKTGNITQNEDAEQQNIIIIVGADYGKEAAGTTQTSQQETTPAKINILNGVGVQGIAKKVQKLLEDKLNAQTKVIDVIETKNAANFNYKQTEIIYFSDNDEIKNLASEIQTILGVGVVKYSENNPDNVMLSVIIGKDYTQK